MNFGRGIAQFQTKLGALFSILIYTLVVFYGTKRLQKFYSRGDTIIFESVQNNFVDVQFEFGGVDGL